MSVFFERNRGEGALIENFKTKFQDDRETQSSALAEQIGRDSPAAHAGKPPRLSW